MSLPTISPQQARELAAAAIVPEKTVRRAYKDPARSRAATIERLRRAAKKLGIPAPGEASAA